MYICRYHLTNDLEIDRDRGQARWDEDTVDRAGKIVTFQFFVYRLLKHKQIFKR